MKVELEEVDISAGLFPQYPEKKFTQAEIKDLQRMMDEDEVEDLRFIRQLASETIDFKGFDHINCYTLDNYRNGTLYALEQTRKGIETATAEKIIDYFYILGYAIKRIVYACYEAGFMNVNRTMVGKYCRTHRERLNKERDKLMKQLDQVASGVFQNMKAQVMAVERTTLDILLAAQEGLNKELAQLDPLVDRKKFRDTLELLGDIQNKLNAMNGIDGLRKVSIDIAKTQKVEEIKRVVQNGWLDDELKDVIDKKKAALALGKEESGQGMKTLDASTTIVLE